MKLNPFYENRIPLEQIESGLVKTQAVLEAILPEWQKLTITPLTIGLLMSFLDGENRAKVEDIEMFLLREMAIKAKLNGAQFDESKVLTLLNKPDISELLEKLELLRGYFPGPGYQSGFYIDCFYIDDNKVVRNAEAIDVRKSPYRHFVEANGDVKRLAEIMAIIDPIQKLIDRYPDIPASKFEVDDIIIAEDRHLYPNPYFVKTGELRGPGLIYAPLSQSDRDKFKSAPGETAAFMTAGEPAADDVAMAGEIAQRHNAGRIQRKKI